MSKKKIFWKRLLILIACLPVWIIFSSTKENDPQVKKILFGGDLCFGETYFKKLEGRGKENILKTKGYDYSFERLESLLSMADVIIGNLETPITQLLTSPLADSTKYKLHNADIEKTPDALKKHRISVVSLANNHTMDYGPMGLNQTMNILKNNSIDFFGAGANEELASKPYEAMFASGNRKFHLIIAGGLAYSEKYDESYDFYADEKDAGVKKWSLEKVAGQIKDMRSKDSVAFIVAYPHWLENYKWKSDKQTALAHAMIDAGANMVIGHGTHMFQEIELYKGKWIIYSLGNLVFNSPGRYEKTKAHPYSLAAMLVLHENSPGLVLQLYPIFSDNLQTNYQSRLVNKNEFNEALELLLSHSPDRTTLEGKLKFQSNGTEFYWELALTN